MAAGPEFLRLAAARGCFLDTSVFRLNTAMLAVDRAAIGPREGRLHAAAGERHSEADGLVGLVAQTVEDYVALAVSCSDAAMATGQSSVLKLRAVLFDDIAVIARWKISCQRDKSRLTTGDSIRDMKRSASPDEKMCKVYNSVLEKLISKKSPDSQEQA